MIWFGSIDSTTISWNTVIYEFCQICASYLHVRRVLTVHVSSLFILFAPINGLLGNNVWKSEKPLSLTENVMKMNEDNFWKRPCFEKWPENQNYSSNFNALGLIFFFRRSCFIWWNKRRYIFEYQSNENRAFRFFGTPDIGAQRHLKE